VFVFSTKEKLSTLRPPQITPEWLLRGAVRCHAAFDPRSNRSVGEGELFGFSFAKRSIVSIVVSLARAYPTNGAYDCLLEKVPPFLSSSCWIFQ
jgi:hypothetical protein